MLRATFLLEAGWRLRSLIHKPSGRELLDVNPVFQPANLALRNAWFSGGVEWNIGTTGHSPFTCSPLFAVRVDMPGGCPMLRMYEWERIRQVPFQIDAYLPDGSPVLFVCVRNRLLEGRAALQTGDLARVALLFDGTLIVDDLREGEQSLSQLWFDYHAQRISRAEGVPVDDGLMSRARRECPVPANLDFRMGGGS